MVTRLTNVLLRFRRLASVAVHLSLAGVSCALAFMLRFDGEPPAWAVTTFWHTLPWLLLVRGASFIPFRLYEGLWRYTSLWDLQKLVGGIASSSVIFWILNSVVIRSPYPRSVYLIDALLLLCMMSGARLTRRVLTELRGSRTGKRVLIYGAGDAGEAIVRDMQRMAQHAYRPVGFVDDSRGKVGKRIHGIPVLGTGNDLAEVMGRTKPDEVLVAMPNAEAATLRRIVRSLDRFNVPIKTLPSLRDMLEQGVGIGHIRDLSLEDLLSRGSVRLDDAPVRAFLVGRRVLVTGAGGSIGGELCRQIANVKVASLILVDHAENGLAQVCGELEDRRGTANVAAVVGDITDHMRMEAIFRSYRPEIVFHAAAHKHVPLMELSPCEAVKNNVGGTRVLADLAQGSGVQRFVLVSSDKAVNPSSVMGATKRIAELLLQTQERSGTSFVTVRFGNVLGSNGSVVPRFQQQIRRGGPVTVTHAEIRRFFMLIPEAVQLVLHAAARGEANHLYVLEMGEQIKVVDMARDMIRLSGLVPDDDIPITFVGLRQGEKMYEELVGADERAVWSGAEKVMEIEPLRLPGRDEFLTQVVELEEQARCGNAENVLARLGMMVPGFSSRGNGLPTSEGSVPACTPRRVLFVCSANVARSRTAEDVFRQIAGHRGHETRSAGTAFSAARRLTTRDMAWADLVAVMEERHLGQIRRAWPGHVQKVRVLDIPDDFNRGEVELRDVLTERIHAVLGDLR